MPGSRVRVPPLLLTPQPLGRFRSGGFSYPSSDPPSELANRNGAGAPEPHTLHLSNLLLTSSSRNGRWYANRRIPDHRRRGAGRGVALGPIINRRARQTMIVGGIMAALAGGALMWPPSRGIISRTSPSTSSVEQPGTGVPEASSSVSRPCCSPWRSEPPSREHSACVPWRARARPAYSNARSVCPLTDATRGSSSPSGTTPSRITSFASSRSPFRRWPATSHPTTRRTRRRWPGSGPCAEAVGTVR